MKKKVYFTFGTNSAGVTDLLTQFSAWYKLGRSLGYQYVHHIDSARSGARVLDFLGFEAIWQDQPQYDFPPESRIELRWSSDEVRLPYTLGLTGLKWFMKRKIRQMSRGIAGNRILVVFRLGNAGDREVFRLIEKSIPSLPDGLDLRARYLARRLENPVPDLYENGKRRVFVHIRQGDATAVPTPWNTFLAVRGTAVKEYPSLGAPLPENPDPVERNTWTSLNWRLEPSDYLRFLEKAMAKKGECYSVVVSSDGFARTYSTIRNAADELGLSSEQIAQLDAQETEHERSSFEVFDRLPNVRLLLGETDENLFAMIHAALTADVIVTSRQQRMIPNLLSLYGREEDPPVFVMLTGWNSRLPYFKELLGPKVGDTYGVNPADLEHSEVKF